MTLQRSPAVNELLDTLIKIYESDTTTKCACSLRMLETLFKQHVGGELESHTRKIIRDEMKARGYKISIGLDVRITKLPVVEVPVEQWPLLIETMVERVKDKAEKTSNRQMRFTIKQFQDLATIWPTAFAFRRKVCDELRKARLYVNFQDRHVVVTKDTDACFT